MNRKPRIALLLDTAHSHGRQLLRGIAQYSRLHGPRVFYRNPTAHQNPSDLKRALAELMKWKPDGIIMRDSKSNQAVLSLGVPTISTVHTHPSIPDIPNIVINDSQTGIVAAEYMLDNGFDNFAFCGFDHMPWSQMRLQGFSERLAKESRQAICFQQHPEKSEQIWAKEQLRIARWLKTLPKPIGIFACNDLRSQNITDAAKIVDIAVPEQVAVLGVDNDEFICNLTDPPLSSISLNTERAGYEAAGLLDKMIKKKKRYNQKIYINPICVMDRQSTNLLAVDDEAIAKAVRFIRENAIKAIQVSDVAEATTVSCRELQRRFKKKLGKTIDAQIRQVRIKHIIHMLTTTDMTISEIAAALDFSDTAHIARYFRKKCNMSLREYRKKYVTKFPAG